MLFDEKTILVLVTTVAIVAVTWYYHAYASTRRKNPPARRPLPALHVLKEATGRGAETGRALHISPGAGTIGRQSTIAETTAGLLAAERVVSEAALNGTPVLVSSGDAVSHLAMRGILRQAYQRAGRAHDYDPASIQLITHENPTAYAAGVMALYEQQRLEASQIIGSVGQEFLLFAEDGATRDLPQVIGSTSITALPVVLLNTPTALVGEEVFAAEAYLTDEPAPQARLMTQDFLRTVVITLIAGGIIYSLLRQLQPQLGLPELPGV